MGELDWRLTEELIAECLIDEEIRQVILAGEGLESGLEGMRARDIRECESFVVLAEILVLPVIGQADQRSRWACIGIVDVISGEIRDRNVRGRNDRSEAVLEDILQIRRTAFEKELRGRGVIPGALHREEPQERGAIGT